MQNLSQLKTYLKQLIAEVLDEREKEAAPSSEYAQSLMLAIGSALTEDQQVWLSSHPQDLPIFLASAEGQALTRRFFTSYKTYHGATNANHPHSTSNA